MVQGKRNHPLPLQPHPQNKSKNQPKTYIAFGTATGGTSSGRLPEALGDQGADELLEHVNNHLIEHKKILRNLTIAKTAAKYIGYGVAGAAGGKAVTHLIH